jgi:hypothetical protein
MATVGLRNATEGRAYFDRKKTDGKSSNEAMRCLKRRLSDAVYRVMVDDLAANMRTDPGGQPGNDSDSSVTGSQPSTGSSESHFPDPPHTSLELRSRRRLDTEGSHERMLARRYAAQRRTSEKARLAAMSVRFCPNRNTLSEAPARRCEPLGVHGGEPLRR